MPWEAFKDMPPGIALLAAVVVIGGGGGSIGLSGIARVSGQFDIIQKDQRDIKKTQREIMERLVGYDWQVRSNTQRLDGNAAKNIQQDSLIEDNEDRITRIELLDHNRQPYDGPYLRGGTP